MSINPPHSFLVGGGEMGERIRARMVGESRGRAGARYGLQPEVGRARDAIAAPARPSALQGLDPHAEITRRGAPGNLSRKPLGAHRRWRRGAIRATHLPESLSLFGFVSASQLRLPSARGRSSAGLRLLNDGSFRRMRHKEKHNG